MTPDAGSKLTDTDTVADYLDKLASRAGTPGGGGASAVAGALGAALCGMVGRLNDKKSGEAGPLHETIETVDGLRARLLDLAHEDAVVFNALMACWRMSDDTPDRDAKMLAATIAATEVPLEIMSVAFQIMELAAIGLEKSKKNCLSDAGVAAFMAHAALEGARLNVMINLPGITDSAKHDELRGKSDALRENARQLRVQIDRVVDEKYR